jgi:hypothetical protein
MKVSEIITELTFHGSQCTKDCSGHRAGWFWSKQKQVNVPANCNGSSNSFKKGCSISATQRANGNNPITPAIRGAKGKFVKFNPNQK